MNGLEDRDLPQDPRDQAWTPAVGPDGRVWVWFETSDDSWIVWDEDEGYRVMANAEFDRQYELDVGDSAGEPQPW